MRIVLLGLGFAGSKLLLPALSRVKGAEVVAVCDPSEEARGSYSGSARVLSDWRETLEVEADAAIVATPVDTHFALAQAVLDNGRHLYLEKPMTSSSQDARLLCRAAELVDKTVRVGFSYRFHPMWASARRLFESGRFSGPYSIDAVFNTPREGEGWQSGVVDRSCHHLDLLSWVMGSLPVSVSASGKSLSAEWDDGTVLDGLYAAAGNEDRITFRNEAGRSLTADRTGKGRLTSEGVALGKAALPHPGVARAMLTGGGSGWERSFEWSLQDFVSSAAAGKKGTPGVREGLDMVLASEAILASLASGQPVAVERA